VEGRGRHWSDDDIYAWFVRRLAEEGSAAEIEPGVIRVVIEPDDDYPDGVTDQVDVVVTRDQLRGLAWALENPFDDRDLEVIPPASDPVLVGLELLSMDVDEDLGTRRQDERFLVFFDGRLRRSVRRELPPVRGVPDPTELLPRPGGHYERRASDR
jgi:hypothetical protein